MNLVTFTDYNNYFGLTANTSLSGQIQTSIDYAVSLVESYCDRIFEAADYIEFSFGPEIFAQQWPINRIKLINTVKEVASIQYIGSGSTGTISKDSNYLQLFEIDNLGEEQTTNIELSAQKTIAKLISAINTTSTFVMSALDSTYNIIPTKFIENIQVIDAKNINYIFGPSTNSYNSKLVEMTNRMINVNSSDRFFIYYNAGYTSSTIPLDLKQAIIQLTGDIYSYTYKSSSGTDFNTTDLKSETIVDYSYTKFDNAKSSEFINKYSSITDKYRKITI